MLQVCNVLQQADRHSRIVGLMIALGAPLTIGELTETVKQGVGGRGGFGIARPPEGGRRPPGGGRRPPRGGTPPKEKFPRPL